MAKIYKSTNPLIKKLSLVFMARALFVVIPSLLMFLIIKFMREENVMASVIMSLLLIQTVLICYVISRYYDILLSGYRGERKLKKIIKRLRRHEDMTIFTNLPIEHRKRRSELDMLIVSTGGVFIIEAKNHSGKINGSGSADKWTRTRYNKNGKPTVKTMDNPFRQTKRQRDILKSILSDSGIDVWVSDIVYFTNPRAELRLELDKKQLAFNNEQALLKYISKNSKKLSKTEYNRINEAFISRLCEKQPT